MSGDQRAAALVVVLAVVLTGCDLDPVGVEPTFLDGVAGQDAVQPDAPFRDAPPDSTVDRHVPRDSLPGTDAAEDRDANDAHLDVEAGPDSAPPVDTGPPCTCSTTARDGGPVTVICGDTTCGVDDNTYLCNAPGGTSNWTLYKSGCS